MLCRDIWCLLKLSVTKILLSMRIVFPAYVCCVYYVSCYTVEEELYCRHRRIKKKKRQWRANFQMYTVFNLQKYIIYNYKSYILNYSISTPQRNERIVEYTVLFVYTYSVYRPYVSARFVRKSYSLQCNFYV